MGDAKCERCGRANVGHAAPVGEHCYVTYEAAGSSGVNESTRGECEKIARVRAPLDAQIATLTRERDAAQTERDAAIAERDRANVEAGRRLDEAHAAVDAAIAEAAGLRARLDEAVTRRPKSEWHEDIGPVLWWNDPISEPPYCGTPLTDDFPDYMKHWTPLLVPVERSSREGAEAKA